MGLFGKKSDKDKSGVPPPSTVNPYAAAPASNNPYAQAKAKAYGTGYGDPASGGGPPPGGPGAGGYGNSPYGGPVGGPPPASSNAYGSAAPPSSNGYGQTAPPSSNGYGGSSGYGANPYAAGGGSSNSYGGYGGNPYGSKNDDEDRNALFGGASDRAQQHQTSGNPYDAANPYGSNDGQAGGYGGYGGGGSSAYSAGPTFQDRQLTAEEQEEEEVGATKSQIRAIKQSDVAATRNALRLAAETEEMGRDTLARLGAQGEHIHNTEKNLDLAQNHVRSAEEKTRELKSVNRSMFAVHVGNPFTSASRQREREQAIVDKHLDERNARESTRKAAYQADQRMQSHFQDLSMEDKKGASSAPKGRNLAERSKYQFEADSDDDQMEDEIENNLDLLGNAAGRLNALARATGREVDEQNRHLDRIAEKTDRVDLDIATGRAKLDRIH